jgi:hypothetical protein
MSEKIVDRLWFLRVKMSEKVDWGFWVNGNVKNCERSEKLSMVV